MPKLLTRNFGVVEYAQDEPFVFPNALPGFPLEKTFLPIEVPDHLPMCYLQSLQTPELCFVALPVQCVMAEYELSPNAEDLACLGLSSDARPGPEMLTLALVCIEEDGNAVANLRAPIVMNVKTRVGVQMIQSEDRYPIRFRLESITEAALCS